MRLQILSDLHLEMGGGTPADVAAARGLELAAVGDVVVLAGDIAAGADGIPWAAAQWPDRPVLYVLGNHEFYHRDAQSVIADCRAAAAATANVHFLECDGVTIGGVRFLGATFWTDFDLFGNVRAGKNAAAELMTDFRVIHDPETGILEPERTRLWHQHSRGWLKAELTAATGPTVVITHHAPHRRSDHFGTTASAGFVSHLPELIVDYAPTLWIHGHTHGRDDYRVGATRVVSNQYGYAGETTGFDPAFTVAVEAPAVAEEQAAG